MSHVTPSDDDRAAARRRRRLTAGVKAALRELNMQLTLLDRQVGAHADLKDADLGCLELLHLHGPLSPSALARHAGLHPATMTGVLDRLQRGGWITRERDPEAADRRAVTVRALPDRAPEMFRLYSGMSTRMDELCADYTEAELGVSGEFLRRTTTAGRSATTALTTSETP
jgi:DNA-binding MarR family transcriptional regulator